MQKIMNQILEGNFNYENGSLDFSCAKIELTLNQGETYEGSFHIYAPEGRFNSGTIMSSDLRMECVTADFIGSEEEVFYRFHGEQLEEGDVVKGNFYVISTLGEYYLPFVVSISHNVLDSSVGAIRNLFHFANLAKTNWNEALKVFYLPEFIDVFKGTDAQFKDDYIALSAYDKSEQNMEEFLIQINKKQKVEYLVPEELTVSEASKGADAYSVIEKDIVITRNGWGYTKLFVECEGDFLFTEKNELTDDDFLGNRGTLPLFVDLNNCRPGKNFGRLYLYNSYVSLVVPITVKVESSRTDNLQDIGRKRSTVQIMELYQAFRSKKINTSTWMKESGRLVEKMVALNENDVVARLFQAQLLITEGSNNEAGWILDHVAELLGRGFGDDTAYAYYLYLTTLLHREEEYVNKVTTDVERIYRKDVSNWRVAWLLLYLSEEYHKSVTGKWVFLEKQFDAGCTSPVLYLEALSMLNSNPALLRKLGLFELQIVKYGIRKDIIKTEVISQVIYLADRQKEYSELLFYCLEKIYQKNQDTQALQQICSQLIKGNKVGAQYYDWYRKGIEKNLRITNLYEYYMMSMNVSEYNEIPKEVLIYFSYQCNLDYERTAYLYAFLLRNQDKYSELLNTFQPKMERFVLEQISKLHISRHLGYLYNRFIQPGMINEKNAEAVSKLVFAHLLRVEDDRIRKVYVYHAGNVSPREYVVCGGTTWVSLYGNEYTIVFEDAYRNRFIKSVEYTLEKLMLPGKLMRLLTSLDTSNLDYDLFVCLHEKEGLLNDELGVERALRIVRAENVENSVRIEIMMQLLEHYHEVDDVKAVAELLNSIPADSLSQVERGKVIRYMLLENKNDLAKQWLETYGPYFIDPKLLMRLIGPMIEDKFTVSDDLLVASAYYAFQKGKYNSDILLYLGRNYQGLTKNLRDIWKAARAFDLDCYELSERILAQMLYSGAFIGEKMNIFSYYISQGAKPEVEDAFLTQCAYEFFVKERITEKLIFDELHRSFGRGDELHLVCKLAFVKYYAENQKEMTPDVAELTNSFLTEFLDQGIYLDFFKEYRKNVRVRQEMADKVIIEYRAKPMARVCVHYVILHDDGESGEYRSEYMKEIYSGVFSKDFVLFFGESLQYYVTEEHGGQEQLTESGTLQKSEIQGEEHDSRYHLLNDIVISKTLQDYDTMEELMEEYYKKEFLNTKLFRLK